jgi:acyl-CoA reductase-like NAD-dependent aldehyde dehydrogenase
VLPYGDVDEAVAIANDSDYGLGGTVWTSASERGLAVAQRIQTGTIRINRYMPDPVAPFGGVKDSRSRAEPGGAGRLRDLEVDLRVTVMNGVPVWLSLDRHLPRPWWRPPHPPARYQ